MKTKLKTRLTLTFSLYAMVLIAILSLASSFFMQEHFKAYITEQQDSTIEKMIYSLSLQYNTTQKTWDTEQIHTLGMLALYDGYILKVQDEFKQTIWDAEAYDMSQCVQIKDAITLEMRSQLPLTQGQFETHTYDLEIANEAIGQVTLSYFGPYFYTDHEFDFINQFSTFLALLSALSLLTAIIIGFYVSKRISKPLLDIIEATHLIASRKGQLNIEKSHPIYEVNQLIQSIHQLSQSLEQQEKLKQQLTSDLAHEIRTPLTSLRLQLEAMAEGWMDITQEQLKICHAETLRLGKLVEDLSRLELIEDHNLKLDLQKHDLKDLVQTVSQTLKASIDEKNIQLHIEGKSVQLLLDELKIKQVLFNLLNNAIKYTPKLGSINIKISTKRDQVYLSILDTGIGIDEKDLPFIFERFYRTDASRNRDSGGSGIGLTIVKAIMDAHHGDIKVESKVNQGSQFTLIFKKN